VPFIILGDHLSPQPDKLTGHIAFSYPVFSLKVANLIASITRKVSSFPIIPRFVSIISRNAYMTFLIGITEYLSKYVEATDTTVEKLNISFDWLLSEEDGNLRFIVPTADLFSSNGLLDIAATMTNISTTGFKAKLFTKEGYGDISKKYPMTGLLLADFVLYNVTDSAAVTITSVTEDPEGTYTFAFTAQTSADVLRLTPSLDGYDFTSVVATTVTIP